MGDDIVITLRVMTCNIRQIELAQSELRFCPSCLCVFTCERVRVCVPARNEPWAWAGRTIGLRQVMHVQGMNPPTQGPVQLNGVAAQAGRCEVIASLPPLLFPYTNTLVHARCFTCLYISSLCCSLGLPR